MAESKGGESNVKLLDSVKKLLKDLTEQQDVKSYGGNKQTTNSLNELTDHVCSTMLRHPSTSNPLLISNIIETLVYAYANVEQDIRLCASENLKKLIKALMGNNLYKIQQSLFHELKKNGAPRSVCIALDCYSALYPRTRPQRHHNQSHQFYTVLLRIINREEEVIHERLLDALPNILPTMAPFLSSQQVQGLMIQLSQNLSKSSASYRRMMASAISLLCQHCKSRTATTEWIATKLISQASAYTASHYVIQGVLLVFHQLLLHSADKGLNLSLTKQLYSLCISCIMYCEQNTINSSLEVLEQLLSSASVEFRSYLTSSCSSPNQAPNLWVAEIGNEPALDERSDTGSQLDAPLELYFDMEESMEGSGTHSTEVITTPPRPGGGGVVPITNQPTSVPGLLHLGGRCSPTSSVDSWAASVVSLTEDSCFASLCSSVPIQDLTDYIQNNILTHKRVSIRSVGIACLAACASIDGSFITDLSVFDSFIEAEDPKLVSKMANLLACVIVAELRACSLSFDKCRPLVKEACDKIDGILSSEVATILKAACEAIQHCLPLLLSSTHPHIGVKLLKKLMNLIDVNYWLLKVELLETFAVVNYAQLAIVEPSILSMILEDVVFPLINDTDHRVRAAVSNALAQLARTLDSPEDPLQKLALQHIQSSFSHLYVKPMELSLAGIQRIDSFVVPSIPTCLEVIVWHCMILLGSSDDQTAQKGALEVLCRLSEEYPPPTLPNLWSVDGSQCGLLELLLQLFRGSWLAWQVQTHTQILQLSTSLFLSCALDSLQQAVTDGRVWDKGIERVGVVRHSTTLLLHLLKLLNIFQRVIDSKELEDKDTKNVILKKMETLSPKGKPIGKLTPGGGGGDHPPPPPKELIGNTFGSPHYQKLFASLNAAFSNYQVSIDPSDDDRFTCMLTQLHNCLSAVFEVSLAEEVGRHVEEIVGYLTVTVKVDAPGALLCVQQLLNALFGLNVATQQTHMYSPFLCSLPYSLKTPPSPTSSDSLSDTLVTAPIQLMYQSLQHNAPVSHDPQPLQQKVTKKKTRFFSFGGGKNKKMSKAVNPLASIKEYLVHFEGLVVQSIRFFSATSSILVQERVLYLMVQLLHLQVNYKMLDCNSVFLESVNRQVLLMESGNIKGGAQLVPHLFQFLVTLAYDSKLVSIPEIIQKCDSVMASGRNVTTFAVPALRPLVMHLYIRTMEGPPTDELTTQREVTLNMLLRLIIYPSVIDMLINVLECYQHNAMEWVNTSSLIYAFLLAPIGRLQVELDNMSAIISLHHLFNTMTPSTISIQTLMVAQMKPTQVDSPLYLTRWMGTLSCILRLMYTIFPEDRFFKEIEKMSTITPTLVHNGVQISLAKAVDSIDTAQSESSMMFAGFLLDTILLGVKCICLMLQSQEQKGIEILANVTTDILILITTLIEKDYPILKSALAYIMPSESLIECLMGVAHYYPLIPLHFMSLLVSLSSERLSDCMRSLLGQFRQSMSSNQQLLLHSIILVVPNPETWADVIDPNILYPFITGEYLMEFIKKACHNEVFTSNLKSMILSTPLDTVNNCIKVMSLIRSLDNGGRGCQMECLLMVARQLVTHPMKGINKEAESLLIEMLPSCEPSNEQLKDIIDSIEPCKNRSPKLWRIINTMAGNPLPSSTSSSIMSDQGNLVMELNKDWHKALIQTCCISPRLLTPLNTTLSHSALTFTSLLLTLTKDDMTDIIMNEDFPIHIIEECVVHSIMSYLSKPNQQPTTDYTSITISPQYESLISVSVDKILHYIKQYSINVGKDSSYAFNAPFIARALIWLILTTSSTVPGIALTQDTIDLCLSFARSFFSFTVCSTLRDDSVAMDTAMDLCSSLLQCKEVCDCVSVDWLSSVVQVLVSVVENQFDCEYTDDTVKDNTGIDLAISQLRWIFSIILLAPPLTFAPPINTLTMCLSRLNQLTNSVIIPSLLTSMVEGVVSERQLDKSLNDSDVLIEYMQRINLIGWSSKNQFEERWMQLLGVLNTAPPHEEMPIEEHLAYNMSVCTALRSAMSLLYSLTLRPVSGNTVWSTPLHTHRNKDFNFLSSPAGKKLLPHRSLIESQIILDCSERTNCQSRYQILMKHEVLALTYPPVFAQNLERPIGSFDLTLCQLSYTSLLPIILKTEVNSSSTTIDGVDMRSCVISLIELFTHWFTQPTDLLLLHHTLTSIVMLSDLFFLSNQFDWMLTTFLNLYQTHPQEDLISEPMLVFGILKAASILRVDEVEAERITKIVEQSLNTDTFINTHNACLEGLLFLVENAESAILSLVGPNVARYILNHLDQYQSYSERHMMLVWSLGAHLALLQSHTQPTKDPNFTTLLLEHLSPLLADPHTSSRVTRSVFLGLEYLVLSFTLSAKDKSTIMGIATQRFMKSDQYKSTSALACLLTCMYTGEEADRVSGLAISQNMQNLKDSVYQSRENISNLLERLRHGNELEVAFLIDLLAGIIVDFLPPMDAMNMVVTEVISQQQSRPWMAAMIMAKTFELLIQGEMNSSKPSSRSVSVMEWVLLSLDSFIQQEPERHAVWCITCLLIAGSTDSILRAVYPIVVHRLYPDEDWLDKMLCTAAYSFYNKSNFPQEEKKSFCNRFLKSQYPVLHRLVHSLN